MASVTPRTTTNGRVWDVRYRDHTGRHRSKTFARKVDAEKHRGTVVADMARGDWIDPDRSKETIGVWVDRLTTTKLDLKPASLERHRVTVRAQIKPRWSTTPLAAVTHGDVLDWLEELRTDSLAPSTIRKARNVLAETFELAIRSGATRTNPCSGTKIKAATRREHRYLTVDEIERLAHQITNPPEHRSRPYDGPRPELGLLVKVAAATGLRQGELLALTRRRIDLDRARVDVRESVSEAGGHLRVGPTKTEKYRTVPLPATLLGPLSTHLDGLAAGAYVWPSQTGGPLRAGALYRRHYVPATRRAGLAPLRFHDLRHTYAAMLISLNVPLKLVQQLMGHSSIAVTGDVYGHLYDFVETDMIDRLNDLLSP